MIFEWSDHDKKSMEFYSQFIKKNDVCFDIGANVGNRTKLFLKLAKNVVAVEPQKNCYKKLCNFFENDINDKLKVLNIALGDSPGKSEMYINKVSTTLSTLSKEWIDSTKKSGRFKNHEWNDRQEVDVSTLDHLIGKYGKPSFIKIDVEGFELEVLKGLSTPVGVISIEFATEFLDKTLQCIDHLKSIGEIECNISKEESMEMSFNNWQSTDSIKRTLNNLKDDFKYFGDVYIRFK